MIHFIYIYFMINCYIAGREGESDLLLSLFYILFGFPFVIGSILVFIFVRLFEVIQFKTLYRICFTDYFANMSQRTIDIKKNQYHGRFINKRSNFNRYNRFLMRLIDKKYNYGITGK